MMKRLTLALGASALLAGGAFAETPTNPDQCLQAAVELAQSAEKKQLADAKLDKIEQLLIKMEDHCDAGRFNDAMAVAKDIETEINAQ